MPYQEFSRALRAGLLVTAICSFLLFATSAWSQTPAPPDGTIPQQPAQVRTLADSKVALQNGAFTSGIAIDVPAFRGITPQLRLSYSSSGGNGFVGVGWDLSGFSTIERASPGRGSPRYSQAWSNDTYLLDGEELIPSAALGGTHATLRQSFLRITGNGNVWTVTQKNGTVMTFNPVFQTGAGTFRWGLSQVRDTHGNVVNYNWFCDSDWTGRTLDCYPASVSYANIVIAFNRESRPDTESFATGKELGQRRYRLSSIDVAVGGSRRNSYSLTYITSIRTDRSLLTKVQPYGRDGASWLPPTTMGYSDTTSGFDTAVNISDRYGLNSAIWYHAIVHAADFNGDGRADLLFQDKQNINAPKAYLVLANASGDFNNAIDITNQYGLNSTTWYNASPTIADFNGDGKMDLLLHDRNASGRPQASLLLANASGGFTNAVDITSQYGLTSNTWFYANLISADFNGDGRSDLIVQDKNVSNRPQANLLLANATGGFDNSVDLTTQYGLTANVWYGSTPVVGDFNGDGKVDLFLQYAFGTTHKAYLLQASTSGFVNVVDVTSQYGLNPTVWRCSRLLPGDFNGDGKTDLFLQRDSGCLESGSAHYLLYAHGADEGITSSNLIFDDAINVTNLYGMSDDKWWRADLMSGDFNGDGRTDLLLKSWVEPQIDPHMVLFSSGDGFRDAVDVTNLYGMSTKDWAYTNPRIADYDGDGDDDIVVQGLVSGFPIPHQFLRGTSATSNVVTTMANGYGGTTTVVYEPSSRWLNSNNPPRSQTVSALIVTDGRAGSTTTIYDYAGGAWDPVERRHLGFRYVKVIDPTGAYEESYYYQGKSFQLGEVEDYYRKNASGGVMTRRYRTVTGSAAAPWVRNLTQEDNFECNGDLTCKSERKGYIYDAYGNVFILTEHGDTSVSGDERTTVSYFYANSAAYLVGYPANVALRIGPTASGTIIAQTLTYYDNATLTTTPPTKGDATRIERRVDSAGKFLATTFTYDNYGNRTSETDPLGHTTTAAWQTSYGLYPSSQTNALGHVTTWTWDEVCGVKKTEVDPNTLTTTWLYDNLCRKSQETRPDGGYTQWFYNSFGSPSTQHVREEVRDGTADDLWKLTYFDGLGRPYWVTSEGDRTVETTYDNRGAVATVSAPFATGETKKLTSYLYDALGRVTMVTHPDSSTQQHLYGDWTTTSCDELGKPRTRYRDAYNRVRQVREYLGKSCVLAPAGTLGLDMFDTAIGYDHLDRQVSIVDSKGNTSSFTYDMAGRQTQRVDPDFGTWIFGYDDDGRMISQTDAKGLILQFDYDALDRLTLKKTSGGNVLGSFYYDEPGHGFGIGRQTRMAYPKGNAWYDYDAMGRITEEWRSMGFQVTGGSLPSESAMIAADGAEVEASAGPTSFQFNVKTTYDYLGRIASIRYPDGEVVTNGYDASGRLYSVGSYVTAATYDARDNLKTRTLGNGAVENFGYDADRFWGLSYVAKKGATTLHDVSFGRNYRGEVTSRYNLLLGGDRWNYVYDDLRRLTTATNTWNAGYSQTFGYDSIGRMTSQTGVGNYSYPTAGRPVHAPATAGAMTLSYDLNGRLTSEGSRTITYDIEGRAALVQDTVNYTYTESHEYDADGKLVKTNSTKFVSGLYEYDVSTTMGTKYVFFGSTRIARKRAGVTHYYHGDQIGSASVITDAAGTIVKRKMFSPFGKLIWQAGTLNDDPFGLAAQRMEGSGLYQMGARKMTTGLGIFTAPDPSDATDPERPQTLNRFAYANNSPTNLVDPSGYQAEEPEDNGDYDGSPADPKAASAASAEAHIAFQKIGIYKRISEGKFRSGEALAEAWGEVALPIAREYNIELGANIYKAPHSGAFALGPTGSSGARTWLDVGDLRGLTDPSFVWTGTVHTHPVGNYLSMGVRSGGKTVPHQAWAYVSESGNRIIDIDSGDIRQAWDSGRTVYVYGDGGLRYWSPTQFFDTHPPGYGDYVCKLTVPPQC